LFSNASRLRHTVDASRDEVTTVEVGPGQTDSQDILSKNHEDIEVMIARDALTATTQPNFIGAWSIEDASVCDDLVCFFEENIDTARPGAVGHGTVQREVKDSLDLQINPTQLALPQYAPFKRYMDTLHACYRDYLSQWPFLDDMLEHIHIGAFNVQKYGPGGHFSSLHTERSTLAHAHRLLVWMTYLNDVEAAGETEFPHYGLKVAPRRGRTLIWPAEWTHAHRGLPVGAGTKTIITGWFHFPDN
jgi:prolyl 4-hydroxylase